MPGSTSNLSVDEQQVVVVAAAAAAKRKEDDAAATTRKTLDEARAHERAAALAWEKEKTIARHLEQQLIAAQGITIPQDDDDDCSVDVGSNPNAALTAHMHAQAASLQNI
jgi:hypothetical protein